MCARTNTPVLRTALAIVAAALMAVGPAARCADLDLEQYYEPNRCGPIALYCVCKSYDIETTIDELAELAEFDGRETSVAGLIKAAEAKGLQAEAFESSLRHLTTLGGPGIIDYPKGHFCAFMGWEGLKARIL
ncbi:MAG TPA: cysteine peptidase family C39 domain-containing protein, partial [Pirellulales bacterium]|nr:cysteine peptidase family C39 domain-containing protein [Pirellulales bacterium]